MVMDEWLYIVLLNRSANVASYVPLDYLVNAKTAPSPPKKNLKALCLLVFFQGNKARESHSLNINIFV